MEAHHLVAIGGAARVLGTGTGSDVFTVLLEAGDGPRGAADLEEHLDDPREGRPPSRPAGAEYYLHHPPGGVADGEFRQRWEKGGRRGRLTGRRRQRRAASGLGGLQRALMAALLPVMSPLLRALILERWRRRRSRQQRPAGH